MAAEKGYLQVVKHLLERGADLHAKNDKALQMAARNGHRELVKYLLEQGADLHAENDEELQLAAVNGHLEVVKCLLEQGADSNLITEQMLVRLFTSYDLQITKNIPRLTSLLLKIDLVKKSYQIRVRNKKYQLIRKKIISSLVILIYHLYYLPTGPAFFQAIG